MEMGRGDNRRKELLELLAEAMNCQYLSDLCETKQKMKCRSAVSRVPASAYPVEEWRDAACYITGRDSVGATAEEVKAWIMGSMEMQK